MALVTPRPLHRLGGLALGGVLAVGLLAACGGDEEVPEQPDAAETSASATESADSEDTSYLPVPEGVTLAEPGTELGFGDSATVAWRPRQDTVVALDVTVERVDVTSWEESFDGWVVTREMRGQTPYFAHVSVRNVGDTDAGGQMVQLYGLDRTGVLVEPLGFQEQTFRPCPGGPLPQRFPNGKATELCLVYLSPAGSELEGVAFDLVGELEPVTWAGRFTPIEKPDRDEKRRDRDRQG